jgi:hypothetical protein
LVGYIERTGLYVVIHFKGFSGWDLVYFGGMKCWRWYVVTIPDPTIPLFFISWSKERFLWVILSFQKYLKHENKMKCFWFEWCQISIKTRLQSMLVIFTFVEMEFLVAYGHGFSHYLTPQTATKIRGVTSTRLI